MNKCETCGSCTYWRTNIVSEEGGDNFGTCDCAKSMLFGDSSWFDDTCPEHAPKDKPNE